MLYAREVSPTHTHCHPTNLVENSRVHPQSCHPLHCAPTKPRNNKKAVGRNMFHVYSAYPQTLMSELRPRMHAQFGLGWGLGLWWVELRMKRRVGKLGRSGSMASTV
jgi:hypothetical protein